MRTEIQNELALTPRWLWHIYRNRCRIHVLNGLHWIAFDEPIHALTHRHTLTLTLTLTPTLTINCSEPLDPILYRNARRCEKLATRLDSGYIDWTFGLCDSQNKLWEERPICTYPVYTCHHRDVRHSHRPYVRGVSSSVTYIKYACIIYICIKHTLQLRSVVLLY